ncbi:ribonuclease H-like domain-containing protein [Tanacetum coccineum]
MSGTQDENPPPPPPQPTQQTPTQQTPHTVSTIKLPILKKGEYDIWAMKMEHYLAHTDYPIWEVIQNGNGPVSVTTDTSGQIKILPPKTAEEIVARERERKARTTLLMAIPEDHLAKFHKMTDAKEMWNAIKSRFGGNDESKKMQKYILKQQFEGFTVSNTDGIHKGYERFQSLLSQLEIHGAGVSTEDANQKFLRSLPSAWLQVSLIMRNKPGMDSLSFDDLYNNLRVFENDVKGSTASSSNLQNVAFVSENTSSTNDVSTAYGVSNTSGHNSKHEQTSSYSLLASQSSCPQLDHEDLDQVDEYDLEEMDLKWQVAMISMRIKKFYKKTGRKLQFDAKEPVGFDKTKVECYNCHKTGHFARECRTKEDNRRRDGWNPGNKDGSRTGKKEESKALVTVDGESVDWTTHSEDDENYAFMASNSSGSDTQVTQKMMITMLSWLTTPQEQTLREQLSDASVEIKAYTQGLKKVEAQLVVHQQNQLWYEQKIKFMKIDLDDKTDVLTYHKTLLAKAQKDKNDLEVIVDKWNHSSKNLGKIINYSMSARDKFGLGYGDYRYSGTLSYENEVFQSVFRCNANDYENSPLHKRPAKTCEMQAVPPPMTGNYLPTGPDVEIDDSKYTYGPAKTQPELDTCVSNMSTKSSELEQILEGNPNRRLSISGGDYYLAMQKETFVGHSTNRAEYVAVQDVWSSLDSNQLESWLDGSDGKIHLYLEDMFVKALRRSEESLRRVSDGAESIPDTYRRFQIRNRLSPVLYAGLNGLLLLDVYQKRISKEQRQQRKSLSKKKRVQQESVSKQGRKNAKGDGKTKENAQNEGRSKEMMDEDKENDEVGLSTEDEVSTAKEKLSTDSEKVSTDRPKLSTDDFKVSTDEQMESTDDQVDASEDIFEGSKDQGEGTKEKVESTTEQKESTEEQRVGTEEQSKEEIASQASQTSTQTPTSMTFGDDETIATLLLNMSKAKAVSKQKEKVESDEELARKVLKKNGKRILAEKLHEQEREQYSIEERAKFLHEYNLLLRELSRPEQKLPDGCKIREMSTMLFDGFLGYFQFPIDHLINEVDNLQQPFRWTFAYRRMLLVMQCTRHVSKGVWTTKSCAKFGKSATFGSSEGIVLGIRFLNRDLRVDKEKVDVIAKLSHPRTVKVKANLCNVDEMPQNFSKFAKSLTCGALTLWGHSRLQEGTNIYSWQSITYQNGLKQKRSPPMMPELFDFCRIVKTSHAQYPHEFQLSASFWESSIKSN